MAHGSDLDFCLFKINLTHKAYILKTDLVYDLGGAPQ